MTIIQLAASSPFTGLNGQTITGNSSGAWTITANGTNQNITLTPSGTGVLNLSKPSAAFHIVDSSGTLTNWANLQMIDADAFYVQAINNPIKIYATGTGTINFYPGGAEAGRFFANGRFAIGTTADSGARLQIGINTDTTSAGGMVFGTDTSFYRSAAGTLTIQGATNTILQFAEGASASVRIQQSSGACYIDTQSAQPIILRTNNTTALTLDSSQNAAFAGTVKPILATTAGAPAYVKGSIYFDTTLNKLRVGGAAAWETITSA